MRRIHLVPFVVGLLAAWCTGGCADNESSLFVAGVVTPKAPECLASGDASGARLAEGILDISLRQTYEASLLVGSQLVGRASPNQVRTETSRVSLRGAEVRIFDEDGAQLKEFTVDGTGFVDPASGSTPGYGLLNATLIPAELATTPRKVVVHVKVFGRTLGGMDITSNELFFPIRLCRKCLIQYPAEANSSGDLSNFICGSTTTQASSEMPCRLGQDATVDCRQCAGYDACLTN